MKHQYFGDISDYRKYNILRTLVSKGNLKPLVCWMLTADDTRSDGNNNLYLKDSATWRKYDPEIYDFIYNKITHENIKDLSTVEKSDLLNGIAFFNKILEDPLNSRSNYFRDLYSQIFDFDLVFLDPDNGIETKSIKKGGKHSSKYVFLDEINSLWALGKSLLIYQHFPRVDRISYMASQLKQIDDIVDAPHLFALKTSYMAYFAVANEKTAKSIENSFIEIEKNWTPHIEAFAYNKDLKILSKI